MDQQQTLQIITKVARERQKILELPGRQLMTFPPEISQLTWLQTLDLRGNQLTTLPPEISQLTQLQTLSLWGNKLKMLPPQISELSQLRSLDLSGNQLTSLPSEIGQLTRLQELDLSSNQLTSLPSEIGQLIQLQSLVLWDNRLTTLPPEIGRLSRLRSLDLSKNPLPIPPEILNQIRDPQAIITYYLDYLAEHRRLLNEVKVLLVGEGGVGKTSLVNRLIDNAYDPHQTKTEGIRVRRWQLPSLPPTLARETAGGQLRLNLWDFGGQEIMHATHQFFLTRRSLYLVVIDARTGERESNLDYWLQIVRSFGKDSPIIVVINKTDAHHLELDCKGLREKYPTIRAFVQTSCQTGDGIPELEERILREIDDMEHVRTEWPQSWFEVKTRLEEMNRDHITYDNYLQMCVQASITKPDSQRVLVNFLHDLGIILHYRDDPRLEETNILNPDWVTNAVYTILNDPTLSQNHGLLPRRALRTLLDRSRYPATTYDFILGMMRKFELCFPLDTDGESYLLPDLLTKEQPELDWPSADATLNFQYHYPILPNSIIVRFIVRLYLYIHQNTVWRTGVLLTYQNNQALVKADLEAGRITINVTGSPHTRRDFLAVIRSHFDHIHRTLSGLSVKEIIPIPGHPGIYEEYSHLLMLEREGEHTFFPRGLAKRIPIKPLLDGIEPSSVRRTRDPDHAPTTQITHIHIQESQVGVIGDSAKIQDNIHFGSDQD